jgi:2-polyprenyl-3-methyl-5-hydroxy-6-metoxy-1,4-benzoquinol methylase
VPEPIRLPSSAFERLEIAPEDLDVLERFSGLSREECIERLSTHRLSEMAEAWNERRPETGEEIRSFYSETDLYVWELLAWNGSPAYEPYRERLRRLAGTFPPSAFPRALDYGSGIGTAALELARHGYEVTIADIPGRTLDFARARLERHGVPFRAIEVTADVPRLPRAAWDVLVCFDVLEHVKDPSRVARGLVHALPNGGGAAIVAQFSVAGGDFPHHLESGAERFSGDRWDRFIRGHGMRQIGDRLYRKLPPLAVAAQRLHYGIWRATGFEVGRRGIRRGHS